MFTKMYNVTQNDKESHRDTPPQLQNDCNQGQITSDKKDVEKLESSQTSGHISHSGKSSGSP